MTLQFNCANIHLFVHQRQDIFFQSISRFSLDRPVIQRNLPSPHRDRRAGGTIRLGGWGEVKSGFAPLDSLESSHIGPCLSGRAFARRAESDFTNKRHGLQGCVACFTTNQTLVLAIDIVLTTTTLRPRRRKAMKPHYKIRFTGCNTEVLPGSTCSRYRIAQKE